MVHKCSKCHPPPPSFVKCNSDAAFFSDRGETSLNIVLHDKSGVLLAYKMLKLPGLPAVKECEALALLKAISLMRTLGYNQVLFEIDSQMIVNALAYEPHNNTEFWVLTSNCHLLLCFEHGFKVVFIRRHVNGATHALARQSRYAQSPTVRYDILGWLEKELGDYYTAIGH